MSKRLAQTQLTPEELAKNLDEDVDQKQNLDAEDGLATLDELKDRKIIKVKRKIVPEQVASEQQKGKFTLFQTLSTEVKPAAVPTSQQSIFQFKPLVEAESTVEAKTELTDKKSAASGSLTSINWPSFQFQVDQQPMSKSTLFGGDQKPATSLFTTPSTGLFSFGQPAKQNESAPIFDFSKGLGSASIFGGTSSLFGIQQPSDGFSLLKQSTMFTNNGEGKNNDDDDEYAPEQDNEPPIYAEAGADKVVFKSGVQVEKSPYTKVFQKRVNKFKIVAPKDRFKKIDGGHLSLEVMTNAAGQKSYILIFKLLQPLYVGQLTALSKFRRVEEKASKHQLKTSQVFTDPKDKKKVLTYVTINFATFEDMEEFEGQYKLAIETLTKSV